MRHPILFAACAALIAMPAIAWAGDHHGDGGHGKGAMRHFDKMDKNGDGVIDAGEAEAMRARMFARMDTDGDGFVTQAEIAEKRAKRAARQAKRQARHDKHMAEMDSDGDGRVARDEFTASKGHMFDKLDADGDGRITREEMAAHHGKRHKDE